jgi:phosphate transport system protein
VNEKVMAEPIANEEQKQIESEVLALGNLVEGILMATADLLHSSELDSLEWLAEQGRQVHQTRLGIEMGCLGLIASYHPLDDELRPLVAMVEIAAELERMANHGQRIARANYLTADNQLRKPLASVHHLAIEVQVLLDEALTAFAARDLAAARATEKRTAEVEISYQTVRHELLAVMKSKPRIASQAIFLSRSAYNLRRAAERVAGICEWIEFAVEGSLGTGHLAAEAPAQPAQHITLTL